MKDEEVIKLLENAITAIEWKYPLDYAVAFEEAVGAIKKQIPKKVNLNETSRVKALDVESKEIYTYKVVRCPACNNPMTLYKYRRFCEKCGQALDWSDEE